MRSRATILQYGAISLLLLLLACKDQKNTMSLVVKSRTLLDSIPSGSAIMIRKDSIIVVGDDATGLYTCSYSGSGQQKFPIIGLDATIYREEKAVKHDFEAVTTLTIDGEEHLLAFGSGSKHPYRDSLLICRMADLSATRILSLESFYDSLRQKTGISAGDWNIEGAATVGNDIVLLNRATNGLLRFDAAAFLSWLNDVADTSFPAVQYRQLHLPMIDKHEARLSGACTLSEEQMLFCASVEDTPDWIQDGPVLGSFIGVYDWRTETITACHLLKNEQGEVLLEKLESVDAQPRSGNMLDIFAVGDNDNGQSVLFRLEMRDKE